MEIADSRISPSVIEKDKSQEAKACEKPYQDTVSDLLYQGQFGRSALGLTRVTQCAK